MSKYKRDLIQKIISEADGDASSNSSSSSSSTTSTSTDENGTTTTTKTETSESSSENNQNQNDSSNNDDFDAGDDMDFGGDDNSSGVNSEIDTSSDYSGEQNTIPDRSKRERLFREYEELLDAVSYLLEAVEGFSDKEEVKNFKPNKVLVYLVTRLTDIKDKINYIMVNKIKSMDYTKLTTLYISLQANFFALVSLLENVYGIDTTNPEESK